MKIEELKPCLYFTTKQEYLNELYSNKPGDYSFLEPVLYENDFYTAIKMGDDWYMVNDSDFPLVNCRNIDEYIKYIKDNQYEIYNYIREYSYKPETKLNQEELDKFNLVFDLEECKVVNYGEEKRNFFIFSEKYGKEIFNRYYSHITNKINMDIEYIDKAIKTMERM